MLEMIRDWMETKHQEQRVAQARMAVEESQLKQLEEASNIVTERPDSGGWARGMNLANNALVPADRSSMVQQARQMFRFDPNARGALSNLVYYVIGEGAKITPQSKDPRIHRLWREFWNSSRNRMALRQAEIILRTFRDGEAFLQIHRRDAFGMPTWKTTVRFRDPELLKTPPDHLGRSANAIDGIETLPDDPETPLAYYFSSSYDKNAQLDVVPAQDVLHLKIFADSEQKRGETYILAAMENFTQYKEWLRYRIILNKVRTAFVLIKKITGGSSDVMAIQSTMGQSATSRSGETRKRIPPPGTMVTANAGVEYDFKSANINASDAAEDGRSMKLSMAAATNMPEYVFGDASNANYASTLIAESPFVKGIRFWQNFFEFHFKELFKQVIKSAVDAGKLTAPAEEEIFVDPTSKDIVEAGEDKKPTQTETQELSEHEAFWGCDVQWPEIVHREMDKTTSAVVNMVNAKLISESTACSVLGFDYEEEMRKQQLIEDGAAENPFKSGGIDSMDPGEENMDAEMKDLMGSLTPAESDQIMKASDPKSVMDLIAKKRQAGKKPANA